MAGGEDPFSWRFGRWQFDVVTRCVTRGVEMVPLPETETKLLLTLLQHEGAAVSKEQFFAAIWANAVTNENALSTSISRLRQEFGQDIAETVFRYGYRLGIRAERLGSVEEHHALYLAALFIRADDERQRMPDSEWDQAYLGRADDIRSALDWALAMPERKHIAIRLAGASGRVWQRMSALREGRRYLDRAVDRIDDDVRPADAARLLRYAGILCRESDRLRSLVLFQRSTLLYRKLNDPQQLGDVLGLIGGAQLFVGQHESARIALKEAEKLLSISDQSKALLNVFNDLGILAAMRKMPSEAMLYFGQARDLAHLLGDPVREYVIVLNIGELEFDQGAVDRAIERASEAAQGLAAAPATFRLRPLVNLANYHAVAGNLRKAQKAARDALPFVAAEGGHWLRLCLQVWAFLAACSERYADAGRLLGAVDAQFVKIGEVRDASDQLLYDHLIRKLAANLSQDSIEVWRSEGDSWSDAQAVQWVQDHLAVPGRSRSVKGA